MKTLTLTGVLLTVAASLLATETGVAAPQDWQERRLLDPTPQQRVAELGGQVMIYDGLHERAVNRALDSQFGRIQNMMFIRVKHTEPDGEEWVEDDCD